MDSRQFLASLRHVANASNGIACMRELVIQLAISGRIVKAGYRDTPVAESLVRSERQRSEYQTRLELRRKELAGQVAASPYAIPTHWQWAPLDRLVLYVQRGKSPVYADRGSVQVVSQKCVHWSGFISAPARFVADDSLPKYGQERFLQPGDILLNSTGTGTVGRAVVFGEGHTGRFVADSHVMVIRCSAALLPAYLHCVLGSPWTQARFDPKHAESLVSGSTQQVELATSTLRNLPVAVPPVEEQARIVAKVDEVMALCDKLELQQENRRRLQRDLREITIRTLSTSITLQELRTNWARLDNSLGQLFRAPEDVPLFRDAVLVLALRGILANIESSVAPKADTRSLPPGWAWKTLSDIDVTEYITSGSRSWKEYVANSGDSFIRSQDIRTDALVFENPTFVNLPEKVEGKRTLVRQGDLLLTITGGNVGRCAVVPALPGNAYVSQHVALIRLKHLWLSKFIHLWMINSFGGRHFLSRYIYGDKPGLNLNQVANVPIPVPSEADCTRILEIVHRYDILFAKYERELRSRETLAAALAKAAVSHFTGVVSDEEQVMKAPKTELIARLRIGSPPGVEIQAPLTTLLARMNGEVEARDLFQRFGGDIDWFYAQLKTEVSNGWIREPEEAEMRERTVDSPED